MGAIRSQSVLCGLSEETAFAAFPHNICDLCLLGYIYHTIFYPACQLISEYSLLFISSEYLSEHVGNCSLVQ